MELSRSEENYLKAIYHLAQTERDGISTNAISERLETKPSSVTDMVQRLAEKKMLTYKKYKGTKLTKEGEKFAVTIIRKHRLWETFLVNKLGFNWDEVHEIAEQLEHIRSEELIDRLDAFLDYPKNDPHGDPIPDQEGNFNKTQKRLLSALKVGEAGICVGVRDSDDAFLKYLNKKKIAIGSQINILSMESFDNSLQIEVDGKIFFVSKLISDNLYVRTIDHYGTNS